MRPKTQYELNGGWTTTEQSYMLLDSIASDTDADVEVIGYSHEDNPIHAVTIGAGSNVLLVTSGVHRNEQAAREGILSQMLDVCYDEAGKYTEYLNSHKIVFIPTVQPDLNNSRVNAQGLDINRDGFDLNTPEARAVIKKTSRLNVDIYVDFHERSGTNDKVEFVRRSGLDPNLHSTLSDGGAAFLQHIMDGLDAQGITNGFYPDSIVAPNGIGSIASLQGAINTTVETFLRSENTDGRVQYHKDVFDLTLDFHANRKDIIDRIKNNYSPSPFEKSEAFNLYTGDLSYYSTIDYMPIKTPKNYLLDDPSKFNKWMTALNLEVGPEEEIPTHQKSGGAVIHLLESASGLKVEGINAQRVEHPEPDRRDDGRYTKVKYDAWEEVFIKNYLSAPN